MGLNNARFETLQVHAGQVVDQTTHSRAVPIYQTSSYVFEDAKDGADLFGLKKFGNIYTRLMNPTTDVFEKRIAALEGGVAALAVASGAAAITYTFQNLAKSGEHIVSSKTIYGGTYNLLASTLPDYGITATFVDPSDTQNFEDAVQENTKAIFIETLGNPNSNVSDIEEIAKIAQPKIIVCGASAYAREIDFKKFREIADAVGAILFADIAHIAGLVAAGEHMSPFPYADVVTTTTHKTLRGPRGGMILTNDEEISKKINSAIFPGIQGGPLVHVIAAKAVAFKEILDPKWKDYAKQVKANIKVLADVLIKRGYDLVSGGTDNHLVLVSFLNKPFSGKDADAALGNAGITVNKNTVPGETRSPFVTSGIRIGSPALTARGMKEKEFEIIANKICDVLDNIEDTALHAKINKELEDLASNFVIYNQSTF